MNARILVVEDEALIAEDISQTLTGLGYEVIASVGTGREALAHAEATKPDMVLMDIRLRGRMDGIEVATALKSRGGPPVVFLTSFSDEDTLARVKAAEPFGYLLKPFSDRELRITIEVALHKHALESRLAERELWFSTTLHSLGDAVIATGPGGAVIFMNEASSALTGWPLAEAQGRALDEVFQLVHPETGTTLESPVTIALAKGIAVPTPERAKLVPRKGVAIEVEHSAAPIVGDGGRTFGGVVVFRDITERRRMEQRLLQAERLASLGTLAAGMAHEINNPLAYVMSNLELALGTLSVADGSRAEITLDTDARNDLRRRLTDAYRGAERVGGIVQNLRQFGKTRELRRERVNLAEALEEALDLTENVIKHHAEVQRDLDTRATVITDKGQLVQVFVNLLMNAAQSMLEGRGARSLIRVKVRVDDEHRAVTEIRDTGVGISEEHLARIFDPFFTTKGAGRGMGLGLSICQGIVANAGGDITVHSELGKGTTLCVRLPVAPTPISDRPVRGFFDEDHTPRVPRLLLRRGRILVIDDDPTLAQTIARVLSLEHETVAIADPHEALTHLLTGARYDAVFCDLMMPVVSGMDIHQALQTERPELISRMVFMTGGAFNARALEFVDRFADTTLNKPFANSELLTLARRLVGS